MMTLTSRSILVAIYGCVLISMASCRNNTKEVNRTEASGVGHVVVMTQEADAGELSQGEVVGLKFNLRNDGDGSFVIVGVDTDCGCTKAIYSGEPVAMGHETTVELMFDTSGLHGYQYKTAKLTAQCGNGIVETVKLRLKAKVR
ncbi:MAG: DUF1573 domain-containing protein [Bacteroidales bacterium]|nr:DUF1573 domain-containing protein [Bacteroidales bacterium]